MCMYYYLVVMSCGLAVKKKKRTASRNYLKNIASYFPYVEGMLIAIFSFGALMGMLLTFVGCILVAVFIAWYMASPIG